MKWLDGPRVERLVHVVLTLGVFALVALGEPQCAAALARVGLPLVVEAPAAAPLKL